jgi:hypothetical protein
MVSTAAQTLAVSCPPDQGPAQPSRTPTRSKKGHWHRGGGGRLIDHRYILAMIADRCGEPPLDDGDHLRSTHTKPSRSLRTVLYCLIANIPQVAFCLLASSSDFACRSSDLCPVQCRPPPDMQKAAGLDGERAESCSGAWVLQPDLVIAEPHEGYPGPTESILAHFDALLGCAPPVMEAHYPFELDRQTGDDEAHGGGETTRPAAI